VVGFSPKVVYPVTAGILGATALFLWSMWLQREDKVETPNSLARRRWASSSSSVKDQAEVGSSATESESSQPRRARFRQALEGPSRKAEAPSSRDFASQDSVIASMMRQDPTIGPAHAAALRGRVWWLERCNASERCRPTLTLADFRGDTPLHYAARQGSTSACRVLLRMGVESARNGFGLAPEHLATHAGHHETASMLREARRGDGVQQSARHLDGLGVFPPPALDQLVDEGVFSKTFASERLRHAVNLAVGFTLLGSKEFPAGSAGVASGAAGEEVAAASRVDEVLRTLGFHLEPVDQADLQHRGGISRLGLSQWWQSTPQGQEDEHRQVLGILLFEASGMVSKDAPGHWVALRSVPLTPVASLRSSTRTGEHGSATPGWGSVQSGRFWRLDPVRGPFELADSEVAELLQRYRAWRIFGRPHVPAVRPAQSPPPPPPPPPLTPG